MKKKMIYLFAAAFMFSATELQAQKGFSLSAKVSPQFSFLQNTDDEDNNRYDQKATFNGGFGIGAAYNFTNESGIALDVLYSLQGQRYTLNGTELNQRVDYIKIPLMYVYNPNPSKAVSLVGKLGPQLSILTSSELDDADGKDVISNTKEKFESATFGMVASVGAQFKLNARSYLTTALRADYDFTNAEDDFYAGYPTGRDDTFNSTIGLEVGLRILLR